MKVFLSTCDKTNHILNTSIYLWNKFTNSSFEIYILGFSKPDNLIEYDNVKFIKLAEKQDTVQLWSKYIYEYLKTIEDEYIIFAMDDELPIDYLNEESLNITLNKMKENTNYGLCNIGNTIYEFGDKQKYNIIYNSNNFNLWERHKHEYKINGQPVLWKTEYLLKQLNKNITPWEFELYNSEKAKNDGYIALHCSSFPGINFKNNINDNINEYNSKKPILNFANETALTGSRGVNNKTNVLGLRYEYIDELIKNNILNINDLIFGLCKNCHVSYEFNKDIYNKYLNNMKSCCNSNSVIVRFNQYYK